MMNNECTICPFCKPDIAIDAAKEVENIHSNTRRFRHEAFTVWRCPNCDSLHCKDPADLDAYYAEYPLKKLKTNWFLQQTYHKRLQYLQTFGFNDTG